MKYKELIKAPYSYNTLMLETLSSIVEERQKENPDLLNIYYLNEMSSEWKNLLTHVSEEIKKKIEELIRVLFELLDGYILQEGYYLDKYIDTIKNYDQERLEHIYLRSYEYRDLEKLPKKLKSVRDAEDLFVTKKPISELRTHLDRCYREDVSIIIDSTVPYNATIDDIKIKFLSKIKGDERQLQYNAKYLDEALELYKEIKSIKAAIKKEKLEIFDMITDMEMNVNKLYEDLIIKNDAIKKAAGYDSKITYDVTRRNEEAYDRFLVISAYYNEMIAVIDMLYTVKIKTYNEMYSNYKEFTYRCIREANVFDHIKKRTREYMAVPSLGVKGDKLRSL